jgi:hypothetical protein
MSKKNLKKGSFLSIISGEDEGTRKFSPSKIKFSNISKLTQEPTQPPQPRIRPRLLSPAVEEKTIEIWKDGSLLLYTGTVLTGTETPHKFGKMLYPNGMCYYLCLIVSL